MEYYLPETFASNCFLVTALKVNDVCDVDEDTCENLLTCYHCEKDVDAVCISGNHCIFLFVDLFLGQDGESTFICNTNGGYECRRRSNVTYSKLIHRLTYFHTNAPVLIEHVKGMGRYKLYIFLLLYNSVDLGSLDAIY